MRKRFDEFWGDKGYVKSRLGRNDVTPISVVQKRAGLAGALSAAGRRTVTLTLPPYFLAVDRMKCPLSLSLPSTAQPSRRNCWPQAERTAQGTRSKRSAMLV